MKPTKEQLATINARLPGSVVDESMIEVLPFMMFDNELTDRFTYMSNEMMAKVVQDLCEGRTAFNALHQSSTTLPIGSSVSGTMRNAGNGLKQVKALMYAVVKNPDGTVAEDGKVVVDKYNTGACRACSAGVKVGFYECSICGNDIRDYRNCEHIPGRTYQKNDQATLCKCKMTGRNIVDGVALDCGAYELSAVTAGGVANAGVLTQAFGKYDGFDGSVSDFKAGIEESLKSGVDHVTFVAASEAPTTQHKELQTMSENNKGAEGVDTALQDRYDALVRKDAQTSAEHGLLKTQYANLEAKVTGLEEKLTASEAKIGEYVQAAAASDEAIAGLKQQIEALQAEYDALKTAEGGIETVKSELETYRAAFAKVVEETGNKLNKTGDYASMKLEDLQSTLEAYSKELADLPTGQLSTDNPGEATTDEKYHGIPAELYSV